MSEQLRIGVVGCGRMGAFHVRNYAQVDCAHLVAVAEPDEESRRRALGDTGAVEFSDWRELIEFGADELDAVSIACPSEYHAEVALEALAADLHVLVEKPIATTLPDALRMRGAAMEADRKLMVGHVERFNPAVAKLRELVADGRLGNVYRAHTTRVGPLPTRIQDTGVAIDLATHDLDVMQHVLDRQIGEIYADGGRFQHGSQEDLLTCLARFGAQGDRRHTRSARRQLADPGEEARDRPDRRERPAPRQLHHPGRLVRRVAQRAAALGRALDAARRRRGCGGSLLAGQDRAIARRARSLLSLRARRHAGASQRPRRRQGACRGPGYARVRRGSPPGRAARHSRPPSAGGTGVIRFVIPAYNEAENIPQLLADLAPVARELGARVIIVDDGSTDGTAEVIRSTPATCTWRSSRHTVNRGLGTAINTGIRAALSESSDDDAIVTLEADTTSDLSDLPRMLELFEQGTDIVLASVYAPGGEDHRSRRAGGWRRARPSRTPFACLAACGRCTRFPRSTASTAPAPCAALLTPTVTCSFASPASPPTSSCC